MQPHYKIQKNYEVTKLDFICFQDESIKNVINKGYRTIFSNYDAWYLDCGYGGWVSNGTNWCAPYKGRYFQ